MYGLFYYIYTMITELALAHIKTLESQIPIWARDAILEHRGEIVNLVRYEQLAKGINSYGGVLGNYALSTQAYADRDRVRVPKTFGERYNFQWSSQTFDNMFLDSVDTTKATYDIETVKGKQILLEEIYGEIFELTPENNKFVNETIIEPYIALKIEENIFDF